MSCNLVSLGICSSSNSLYDTIKAYNTIDSNNLLVSFDIAVRTYRIPLCQCLMRHWHSGILYVLTAISNDTKRLFESIVL